jgi:hypothetical protein
MIKAIAAAETRDLQICLFIREILFYQFQEVSGLIARSKKRGSGMDSGGKIGAVAGRTIR